VEARCSAKRVIAPADARRPKSRPVNGLKKVDPPIVEEAPASPTFTGNNTDRREELEKPDSPPGQLLCRQSRVER
jgi:hypothetical protein